MENIKYNNILLKINEKITPVWSERWWVGAAGVAVLKGTNTRPQVFRGDASWPKESRENIFLIFRPTVPESVIAPPCGQVEMLLGIRWVCHPPTVVEILCWLDVWFVINGYWLQNGRLSVTLEARYERTEWTIAISFEYVHCMGS